MGLRKTKCDALRLKEGTTGYPAAVSHGRLAEPGGGRFDPVAFAKTLPGITAPLGFFDPMGFCSTDKDGKPMTEGKIRFYREVEIKHCRPAAAGASIEVTWQGTSLRATRALLHDRK